MTQNDPVATPPLRIAFYMHDLSGGGVERMRLALIAALRACGLEVTLVVGAKQGALLPFLPADLKVVVLGAKRTLFSVWGLVKFLRAEEPDVLISSLDHNNIAAMLARRMSGVSTRLVICQHNTLSGERKLGWKYRAVPWAYRLLQHEANAIVAVSQGVAEDLARVAKIPLRNISVIYNPVIDQSFSERASQPPPHAWLVDKNRPVFVFVGRLTAQKDATTLLAAMEMAVRRCSARLILVGEGEDKHELRAFARKAGIAHAVAFVGFQANPLPWICHADALVSSSRYEGLGNAIIEALACGTQVIATDCPYGPAEILLDGKLGKLVPVGDAAALADALVNHNPSYYDPRQLRARGDSFTAAACAQAHVRLFNEIIGRQKKAVHALGMNISPLRTHEVVEAIIRGRATESVQLVVTPNLDHVRRLRAPDFAAAYAFAHLVCPDGLPVLVYARLRGLKLPGRVTGCEVFARLIRHEGLRHQRLFLVVESNATALAATRWADQNAISEQTEIAVAPYGLDTDEPAQSALAQRIARAAPTILVMTLGAPVSEVFVHRHRHTLPPCWALCVGQALRVELALARRAPSLWQAFGFEWLWRLAHEPRRLWGRYTRSLAWFPVAIWRDVMRH